MSELTNFRKKILEIKRTWWEIPGIILVAATLLLLSVLLLYSTGSLELWILQIFTAAVMPRVKGQPKRIIIQISPENSSSSEDEETVGLEQGEREHKEVTPQKTAVEPGSQQSSELVKTSAEKNPIPGPSSEGNKGRNLKRSNDHAKETHGTKQKKKSTSTVSDLDESKTQGQNNSASAPSASTLPVSHDSAEQRAKNEDIPLNDQSQSGDGAPTAGDPAQMEFIPGSTCPFSCKTKGTEGKLLTFGSRGYFKKHIKESHEAGYEWCPVSGCNTLFQKNNEGREQLLQRDHFAAAHEGLIKSSKSEDGARVDFTVRSTCPFMCIKMGPTGKLRKYETRKAFKKHLDEIHEVYEWCMVSGCNTLFAKKNERREELQYAHCTNEHKGRLRCSLCPKTVDNVESLRAHFSESHEK